jgi:hypothetical protein
MEAFHECDAVCVTRHAQIEWTKSITRKAVGTALQHDRLWLVILHDGGNNRFEDPFVGKVVDAVSQWHVNSVVLSPAHANVAQVTSPREKFAIFMQRDSHNSVGGIECFLDAIAVVNIDVDVKHAFVKSQ